ncbi:MAG: ATPase [Gammaproteobacteria bacterium]|nr:MAG: ATPase [Gammaproteobacteria bacterium]
MKIKTLRDVLSWTQSFHQELSNTFKELGDTSDSTRLQLLLEYLAEQEQSLANVMDEFEETTSENALNTWCYDFLANNPIQMIDTSEKPLSQWNTTEIINAVEKQHNQVISLYRHLLGHVETPSATDLVKKLLNLEEHEAMKMTQSANRLEDL